MKKLSIIGAAVAAIAAPGAGHAAGELNVFNWTNYTSPEMIEKFEKETGVEVTLDVFDTNETLIAKLKSGGAGYDIIMPSAQYVPEMAAEGLIQKIDAASLPGYDKVKAAWRKPWWDPEGAYVVPWQTGTTSFAADTAIVTEPLDSWKVLFTPPASVEGKVGMLDSLPDLMAAAKLAVGVPQCTEDPKEMQKVLDMLLAQKPAVRTYTSDGGIERMASGDTPLAMMWSGATMRARADRPTLRYAYPKEGVVGWTDTVAVPAGAANLDNAKLFMAFILKPENAAMIANFARYTSPIEGVEAHLDPALGAAPEVNPPAEAKIEFLRQCSPQAQAMNTQVLTKLLQ